MLPDAKLCYDRCYVIDRSYSFSSAIRRVFPVNCSFSFHVGMSRPGSRQGCKEVKDVRKRNRAFNLNKKTHATSARPHYLFNQLMPSPKSTSTSIMVLHFLPPFPGHPCHLAAILSLLQCLVLFVISTLTFTFHLAVY